MSNDITADTISALYESAAATDEYCVETTLNDMPLKIFLRAFFCLLNTAASPSMQRTILTA